MTPQEREKAIEQIRKVQRKADGTSHEAEAEIFLKKVADLMAKHGISEADLKKADLTMLFGHAIYDMKYSDAWRRMIFNMAGRFCGTYVVHMLQTSTMKIYGREFNIQATIETYKWIHDQIREVARAMYPGDTKSYRQAQKGLGLGVSQRIIQILETYRPEGATDTTVPVTSEYMIVKDHVLNNGDMAIVQKKHRQMKGSAALMNGYNNADRINLREHLGGRKPAMAEGPRMIAK